jgi:hypothetical protein
MDDRSTERVTEQDENTRGAWVRPEVHKIDAGAAEAAVGPGQDFGNLS